MDNAHHGPSLTAGVRFGFHLTLSHVIYGGYKYSVSMVNLCIPSKIPNAGLLSFWRLEYFKSLRTFIIFLSWRTAWFRWKVRLVCLPVDDPDLLYYVILYCKYYSDMIRLLFHIHLANLRS